LEVLKGFYCSPSTCGQYQGGKCALIVLVVLSGWDLDAQQGLFKLIMKSNSTQAMDEVVALASNKANPIIVNMLTCVWVGDPCISTFISFLSGILEVDRDQHGSCY
jgi:hypothetical protein